MSDDILHAVDERARIIGVRTQDGVVTQLRFESDGGEQWRVDGEMEVVDPHDEGGT